MSWITLSATVVGVLLLIAIVRGQLDAGHPRYPVAWYSRSTFFGYPAIVAGILSVVAWLASCAINLDTQISILGSLVPIVGWVVLVSAGLVALFYFLGGAYAAVLMSTEDLYNA